jgi:CRP/FNR family transcriptional regulator
MQIKKHDCSFCHNKLCIHKVPIFSSLEYEDLLKISDLIHHKEYQKGELIFLDGEKVDSIVIMNEGSAKAVKYNVEGKEQILYVFSEGDFFGEQYLLNNQTADYSVEALETVKACTLSRDNFRDLLYTHPDIAIKIIEDLGERMSRLENIVQSMGVRSVDARVSGLLIDFAKKYGSNIEGGTLVQLPLSREGIANYLGIARETVSRKFGQLENDGIIQSMNNKAILILNKNALEEIAKIIE